MPEKKIKILTIFGTRKELIKLYPVLELFNRRRTQTYADSIFSLADLSRENLHALRANRF